MPESFDPGEEPDAMFWEDGDDETDDGTAEDGTDGKNVNGSNTACLDLFDSFSYGSTIFGL